jgi:hypothetical protein
METHHYLYKSLIKTSMKVIDLDRALQKSRENSL